MPKDTKSSGYNKAPACESRGFGHKKEGENFDTPSFIYYFTFIQQPLFFRCIFSYTYQALSVTFQSLHPGS